MPSHLPPLLVVVIIFAAFALMAALNVNFICALLCALVALIAFVFHLQQHASTPPKSIF